MRTNWPAPERNKLPILAVLQRVLPACGRLLEIASGSGQHAVYFAQQLPGWRWLPSDIDAANLASVEAYRAEQGSPNLCEPRRLDVCDADWGVGTLDAVFNANMIHIAPWACCLGLLQGVGRHLRVGGLCVLYGPFRVQGAHTAPSNQTFDLRLRAQDPAWGVRDLEAVVEVAARHGLVLRERVQMPANNLSLVFERIAT